MRSSTLSLAVLLFAIWIPSARAQTTPVDAEGHQWWQHAVFYEIYPRSFADSNNDGIGDIPGSRRGSITCIGWGWMPSGSLPCFLLRKWIGDTTSRTITT